MNLQIYTYNNKNNFKLKAKTPINSRKSDYNITIFVTCLKSACNRS